MSADHTSKPNEDQQKAKKPESTQDDAKITNKDADQVKGGRRNNFNPQPDPPG